MHELSVSVSVRREKVTSLTFSGTEQTQSSLTQTKKKSVLNQYLHVSTFMCMQHPNTAISSTFMQIHGSKTSMLASNHDVENPLAVNSVSATRNRFLVPFNPLVVDCWHQLPGSLSFSHSNHCLLNTGISYKATGFSSNQLSTVGIIYQPQFLLSNLLVVND